MKEIGQIVKYCENVKECRHLTLMRYFDDLGNSKLAKKDIDLSLICPGGRCDVCKNPEKLKQQKTDALVLKVGAPVVSLVSTTGNFGKQSSSEATRLRDGSLAMKRSHTSSSKSASIGYGLDDSLKASSENGSFIRLGSHRLNKSSSLDFAGSFQKASSTNFGGFQKASSFSRESHTEDVSNQRMYLFGKSGPRRDSSEISSSQLSHKYPFLARISHNIRDLGMEKRETSYEKIYNFLKETFPIQEEDTCALWQIKNQLTSQEDRR